MSKNPGKHKLGAHEADKIIAFEMRFYGHTYRQIAEKTKYTEGTLSNLFSVSGDWYEPFKEYVDRKKKEMKQQFDGSFIANSASALQAIVNIIHGVAPLEVVTLPDGKEVKRRIELKDSTILKAAQDVLDRAGFKAPEGNPDAPIDKADELTKWFSQNFPERVKEANDSGSSSTSA